MACQLWQLAFNVLVFQVYLRISSFLLLYFLSWNLLGTSRDLLARQTRKSLCRCHIEFSMARWRDDETDILQLFPLEAYLTPGFLWIRVYWLRTTSTVKLLHLFHPLLVDMIVLLQLFGLWDAKIRIYDSVHNSGVIGGYLLVLDQQHVS